ncbi:MAG: glycosyltransferase [Chloracidobacterium sp.]|nr:glycosyltransferase [Chloracidobacterium sp.]
MNGAAFLPACLESIVENPPSCSFEIVVVDNASTDTSVEMDEVRKCKESPG